MSSAPNTETAGIVKEVAVDIISNRLFIIPIIPLIGALNVSLRVSPKSLNICFILVFTFVNASVNFSCRFPMVKNSWMSANFSAIFSFIDVNAVENFSLMLSTVLLNFSLTLAGISVNQVLILFMIDLKFFFNFSNIPVKPFLILGYTFLKFSDIFFGLSI